MIVDVSAEKRAERELLEAKQRTEEANQLALEKNRMLEVLSSKLSKYLSPQLYRSIFSGEQDVAIASKRKKLTVFFSDIAAFTETTDNLESEDLTDVLNHYLTEMSAIALKYGATIDKFIGDAMLLFFGDPESRGVKEDAKACVMMAWRCNAACATWSTSGGTEDSNVPSGSGWESAPAFAPSATSAARIAWITRSSATK